MNEVERKKRSTLKKINGRPRPEVFIDTETTGVNPDRHQIWEIAAIKRELGEISEWSAQIRVANLDTADLDALEICQFRDRYIEYLSVPFQDALADFLFFTRDGVLHGLNVSFDIGFLRSMAARGGVGFEPTWHYSIVDVKSYAAGALGMPPTTASHILAGKLGVSVDSSSRHSALGDAKLTMDIYDASKKLSLD